MSRFRLNNPLFAPLLVFLMSFIPRFWGFWRFPKMIGDEGIYVSQAWWLVHYKSLGPYTYWYDHFPYGWLQIGIWQWLTGGPFTFGLSVISGRLLMILLASLAAVFLWKLIFSLTQSKRIAWLGILIYAFSPLMVTLQRQVLLDNIASFWLVVSLYYLFNNQAKGTRLWLASITFGLAVLSKESIAIFIPGFLFGLWRLNKAKINRPYHWYLGTITILFLVSLFPLLALLKGELFPSQGKVSLLGSLAFQAARGSHLPFWNSGSDFAHVWPFWLALDHFLIILGVGSLILTTIFKRRNKNILILNVLALSFWFFLLRGGVVLEFYILPLLPIFIVIISLWLHTLWRFFSNSVRISPMVLNGTFIIVGLCYLLYGDMVYQVDATRNQIEAVETLRALDIADHHIVADNFAYLDFKFQPNGKPLFDQIEWYTKAESDPEVRQEKLQNDPNQVQTLLVNSIMQTEMEAGLLNFLVKAKQHLNLNQVFPVAYPRKYHLSLRNLPYLVEDLSLYSEPKNSGTDQIYQLVHSLTPEQKIAQHLLFSPAGIELNDREIQQLRQGLAGGVYLLPRNIVDSVQLEKLIAQIRAASLEAPTYPFIAVTQEGGIGSSIPWVNSVSPVDIKSAGEAAEVAKLRSQQLKNSGINLNFGIVADRALDPKSYISKNERIFIDPEYGIAMVQPSMDHKVIPVIKYFPGGLGRSYESPNNDLLKIDITKPELLNDISVYRHYIAQDVPAILITHLLYPQIDSNPTSASRVFMSELLRQDLGFEGIVIVEDLSMSAIKHHYSLGEYALHSLKAGADLILVSEPSDFDSILNYINSKGDNEDIDADSLLKIINIKEKIKL